MRTFARMLVLGTALTLGAGASTFADDAAIKTLGKGPKRDALSALCYKPVDPAALAALSWGSAKPLTAESMKGKPVLIVSWASWFKSSHAGLTQANQLRTANPDLIILPVHQQRGFEQAAATLKTLKLDLPAVHDANGTFFSALKIDGAGPNFFIIDRAGNLRFADVEKSSLEPAIKIVSDETPESAAAAKAPVKDEPKANKGKVTPEMYAAAAWPQHNAKDEVSAKNVQGKPLPVALGKETWITTKPDLAGKVVVLDFWAIWCAPCRAASPILDELQTKFADRAVIIGISGQKRPNMPEDVAAIKKYLAKEKSGYSHANDTKQNVYKGLDVQGIPHVVILSTDGIVRWQGNPHDPAFRTALQTVVNVDPGVKAGKPAGSATKDGGGMPPKP